MASQAELLEEADRRGLLPSDMQAAYAEAKKRGLVEAPHTMSALERFGTGLKDPLIGVAQIGAHIAPETFGKAYRAIEGEELPEGGYDAVVRAREAAIKKARGAAANDIDWWRLGGNVAPYLLGGAAAPELLAGRTLLGAAGLGAASGVLAPTTDETSSFLASKGLQAAGGAVGGTLGNIGGRATGAGLTRLGGYLAEQFPDNMKFLGRQKLLERIRQDLQAAPSRRGSGLTPTELARRVTQLQERGIPQTLADIAGSNVQGLAGNLARAEGPARTITRKFLEERDKAEGKYLSGRVRNYIHSQFPGGTKDVDASAYATLEALSELQSKYAAPLYKQLANHPGVMSERLAIMLESRLMRHALAEGLDEEEILAASRGERFNPADLGLARDAQGNLGIPAAPSMRVLDTVKKGLDAIIEKQRGAGGIPGKLSKQGYAVDQLRRAFIKEIDDLDTSGLYRAAREAWEGPAAARDAVKWGREIFTQSPEEIAHEFGQLSASGKEFARIGVADRIIEKIRKTGIGGDEAKAIAKSEWMRDQLRPIFRNAQDEAGFFEELDLALQRFATKYRIMGGSQTGERMAEDAAASHAKWRTLAGIGHALAHGDPLRAIGNLFRWWEDVGFKPDPKMNAAIAKILFGVRTPPELAAITEHTGKSNVIPEGFTTPRPRVQRRVTDPLSQRVRTLLPQIAAGAAGPATTSMMGQ